MTPDEIKNAIVGLLLKKGRLPDGIDVDDYRYLDEGHIDSLGMIKFIVEIEEKFGVSLTPEDIRSAELRSVGGLVSLVGKKQL